MDIHTEKLNLDELYREKKTREDNKIKIYNRILKRAHDKIKYVSRQRNSLCFCAYVVPEFLLGVPKYDSGACIAYVIDKLVNNGLAVKYVHPNLLMISWNHYIPPQTRQQYKKNTGITIDGFGNVKKKIILNIIMTPIVFCSKIKPYLLKKKILIIRMSILINLKIASFTITTL